MLKKLLSLVTSGVLLLSTASFPLSASAVSVSAGGAVQLEIIAPATAKVGEAIDLTVRALDKDKNLATDYRGSIIFISDYLGDTLPMQGKTITFTDDDGGEKKFSKGMVFKRAGKQKISVADIGNGLDGEVSVLVEEGSSTIVTSSGEVVILTPEANSTVANSTILISGMARKNSKISLTLNGTDIGTVLSDDDGLFTKEVSNITQETNVLKASLLDASNTPVATSPEVNFTYSTSSSSIYGVTVTPSTTVQPSTSIIITVEAVSGLAEVNVEMDGAVLRATEDGTSGKYSVQTVAPQQEGSYPIDVAIKTITAQTTEQKGVATLTVEANEAETVSAPLAVPAFRNVKAETNEERVTFSFSLENPPENLGKFKIMYGTGAGALDSEIITHDADQILKNGVYTWYIATLLPNTYTFKIYALDTTGALIAGLVSDPVTATVGVKGCTISNVGEISVKTDSSKSILSWSGVAGAASYNIYKVDADGKYTLFQSTPNTSYTIFLSQGALVHENFAIKAVCGDGTESADYSRASRVQTGPGMIAFIVVISGFLAMLVLRRRSI